MTNYYEESFIMDPLPLTAEESVLVEFIGFEVKESKGKYFLSTEAGTGLDFYADDVEESEDVSNLLDELFPDGWDELECWE